MRVVQAAAIVLAGAFLATLEAPPAGAADRAISAAKLQIQRKNGKEKLSFSSKDPAFLFPSIGSSDDPTVVGVTVELLSYEEGTAGATVPAGAGKPGWSSKTTAPQTLQFKNAQAPSGISIFKGMLIKSGKQLRIEGRATLTPMLGPMARLAIRITSGSIRNCTVVLAADAKRNEADRFLALRVPAPSISDCSDPSLLPPSSPCGEGGVPTCNGQCSPGETCVGDGFNDVCKCVAPSMPCGDTNPTCNGTCPVGEECASFGFDTPYDQCGCLPEGSTPCGAPNAPVCGGACPSGASCTAVFKPIELGGGVDCDCRGPGAICGNGSAWGGAPNEGFPYGCYPIICNGTYPTCGGPCLDGGVCDAFRISSFTGCVCAVPAPCGGGGFDCAFGDVCHVDPPTPMCGAP